jgi:hypothetical protein
LEGRFVRLIKDDIFVEKVSALDLVEVLTAIIPKDTITWDVTLCSPVDLNGFVEERTVSAPRSFVSGSTVLCWTLASSCI